jgi:purine-binding chemotaxis protein CheW
MDTSEPIKNRYHIVVNTQHVIASFEVDDIGDVVDVPVEEFVPPPDSVRAIDAKFLEGVFPLENEILTVLNVDVVLDAT